MKHEDYIKERDALLPRTNCPASCDGYGTYAQDDGNGEPEPVQCQWCYEVVIPLRQAVDQLCLKVIGDTENDDYDFTPVVGGQIFTDHIRDKQRLVVQGDNQ